jgi:hypothetical protein
VCSLQTSFHNKWMCHWRVFICTRMEENVDGGARDKGNDVRIIGLDLYEILNNS